MVEIGYFNCSDQISLTIVVGWNDLKFQELALIRRKHNYLAQAGVPSRANSRKFLIS